MKVTAKVISDNGYKIELIRPMRDIPLSIGLKVDVEISGDQVDLINLFNGFIDDDTKDKLIEELKSGREAVPVPEKRKADGAPRKT